MLLSSDQQSCTCTCLYSSSNTSHAETPHASCYLLGLGSSGYEPHGETEMNVAPTNRRTALVDMHCDPIGHLKLQVH